MKVIQIGPYPTNPSIIRGGIEASVYGLAQELSKNHQVIVIDSPRIENEDSLENYGSILVHRFHNPGVHQRDAIKRVDDIVKDIINYNPTICHLHGTGIFCWSLIKEIRRKTSIPIILTVHGLARIEKIKALKRHFSSKVFYQYIAQSNCERRVLSTLHKVIVDTQYVEKAIKGYRLRKEPEMVIIPQGIDNHFYTLDCSKTSRNILSVGSITQRKGHLQMIKAFSIAAQELQDIKLIICGVLSDSHYYQQLLNLIDTLPCKDMISLKTDVSKEELYDLYNQAHIFALHSQEESQGIVFAEAMASGLPIIATRVGGIPDVVISGETGLLSGFDDIPSFASSIIDLMQSKEKWEIMSTNCKSAARSYSWLNVAKRIVCLYTSIIPDTI